MTAETICAETLYAKRIQAIKDIVLTEARQGLGDVVMLVSTDRGGYEFRTSQMPFDVYYRRGKLSTGEHRAASNLFRDFTISGQAPGLTCNLNPAGGGNGEFTQTQLEARERWRKAVDAIGGVMGKLMILNVCCYGYWLKEVNYNPYSHAQAFPRFREALQDLAEYYKNNSCAS